MNSVLYLVKSMVVLLVVITLANYLLKYLNRYQRRQNQHIQIIEKQFISKDATLLIVKIIDSYYIMSSSQQNTELIKELSVSEKEDLEIKMQAQRGNEQDKFQQQTLIWQKKMTRMKIFIEKRGQK